MLCKKQVATCPGELTVCWAKGSPYGEWRLAGRSETEGAAQGFLSVGSCPCFSWNTASGCGQQAKVLPVRSLCLPPPPPSWRCIELAVRAFFPGSRCLLPGALGRGKGATGQGLSRLYVHWACSPNRVPSSLEMGSRAEGEWGGMLSPSFSWKLGHQDPWSYVACCYQLFRKDSKGSLIACSPDCGLELAVPIASAGSSFPANPWLPWTS